MFKITESFFLSNQLNQFIVGKTVKELKGRDFEHQFYNLDEYNKLLQNKDLQNALCYGSYIDLNFEDITLSLNNSIKIRYYDKYRPDLDGFIILFNDNSCLVLSNIMENGLRLHGGFWDNSHYIKSKEIISPLDERFNKNFFLSLFNHLKEKVSLLEFFLQKEKDLGLSEGAVKK